MTNTARVLADGRLQVGESIYDSLSAAAKAAAETTSEPGWDFWGAPSGTGGFVPLAQLRARLREDGAPVPAPTQPKPVPASAAGPEAVSLPPATAPKPSRLAEIATERPDLFPLAIFANYHGERVEAIVEPSGQIRFQGQTHASPSTAANAAREAGGFAGAAKVRTNGWDFWRFTDNDGTTKKLRTLRADDEAS